VAAEAQHADVHRAAAADHGHVRRHRAVDERAAAIDERRLSSDVQLVCEVEGARPDLHGRTLPLAAVRKKKPMALRPPRAPRFFLFLVVAALFLPRPADAHPVPFTYLDLRLTPDAIEGTLVAHIFDLGHDLNIDPAERLLDPAIATQQAAAIARLFAGRLTVAADGVTLTPQWSSAQVVADRSSVKLALRYALARAPGTVTIAASMFPYDPQHQTFLNIYEGSALTQAILDAGRTRYEYFTGTASGTVAVVRRFLPAGIAHIVIGPDHLLFLVGLLLLGGTLRQLVVLVTSFTVAHSITMSLAALNILSPPARLIEPAIALSIVYVGADNLLIRDGRDVRALIAGAFGLIHGFGYANVLRDIDLPARALEWALLSINVGVEIGQLLVVAVVAAALAALRARNEAAGQRFAFAGSIVVMAAGAFWFVQRVFFPGGIS
jgi:hydrogenase/urease accessory protein HupE